MTFQIGPDGPIYRQLADQVLAGVKSGLLKPGDRLPTERELAAQLGVARGTVRKAYRELADNNLVQVIQGSGVYIHRDGGQLDSRRRRAAANLVEETLNRLERWGFSPAETEALLRADLARRQTGRGVRAAVIDCNPESLSIFKRQLLQIPDLSVSVLMVESILMEDDPRGLLSEFDLALTTVTHYDQINACLAGSGLRLLKAAMALSPRTIVDVTSLPAESSIGILCSSNKFAGLIAEQLNYFRAKEGRFDVHFESDVQEAARFIEQYDAVVAPPDSLLFSSSAGREALERYRTQGGRAVSFDYQIERGSLIHLEEQISALLRQKYPAGKAPGKV